MAGESDKYVFPGVEAYAFFYEHAHLLWMKWPRASSPSLFVIRGIEEDALVLDHPGETFANRVLGDIEDVFFINVRVDGEVYWPQSQPRQKGWVKMK
ncbi:hypothetical protein GCM10025857_05610 [Alicyclobacillus contaminans]|uniref:hypothetical protein n=1 Tax=Alicyclobacillus contaminans TaxID=392016 RepID=UPI000407A077|nr:hypothetical protein [Alicyclobacillus contaminans]GMA49204.1 hypothetical protein GCM10025857_05610 [Alicyclobacillus contaminans]